MTDASLKPWTVQVAALPIRGAADRREVLLITTRETRRWIIPKGWPMKGRRDHAAAALEALQEAGVTGRVHKHPVGAFSYTKGLSRDRTSFVHVMVYLLEVEREVDDWPERHQRDRLWLPAAEAAGLVDAPALADLIARAHALPNRD